ncbi:MAG: hypothetical protein OSA84_10240 [Akkermansiaceae bacterium]|nr:hypothetical protein [Akkermansiaceae bacterium]
MRARSSCELKVVPHLQAGYDQVHHPIALTLENIVIAGWQLNDCGSAEHELVGRIVDERVFQTGTEVGKAGCIGPQRGVARVDIHKAVLARDGGKPLAEGVFELQRVNLHVTAHGQIARSGIHCAGQVVVHEKRVDVRRRQGEIE